MDNDLRMAENTSGRKRTGAFLEGPNDVIIETDRDSETSYDMLLDDDEEDDFSLDDYLDCADERDALQMVVNGAGEEGDREGEGHGESVEQVEGNYSQSLPPRATTTLIQALQLRLEHLITNIADYPPAQIFVK